MSRIPVANGYRNGPSTQTGLSKALGEMGFVKEGKLTAQIKWQNREREELERICNTHGITVDHPLEETRAHIRTEDYKAKRALEQAIREKDMAIQEAADARNVALTAKSEAISAGRTAREAGRKASQATKKMHQAQKETETAVRQAREANEKAEKAISFAKAAQSEADRIKAQYSSLAEKYNSLVRRFNGLLGTARKLELLMNNDMFHIKERQQTR